ncbi:hypothetical protein F4819DRAFT_441166 [Hypoxylon fuscum]|nr:hypothetical protein F4819DRAFT_441166 [Hypoxylon fuscum]
MHIFCTSQLSHAAIIISISSFVIPLGGAPLPIKLVQCNVLCRLTDIKHPTRVSSKNLKARWLNHYESSLAQRSDSGFEPSN